MESAWELQGVILVYSQSPRDGLDHPPEVLPLCSLQQVPLCRSHSHSKGPQRSPPTRSGTIPAGHQHQQLQGTAGRPTAPLSSATSSLHPQPGSLLSSHAQPCQVGMLWGTVPKCSPHPPTARHVPRARPPSSPWRRRWGLSNTICFGKSASTIPSFLSCISCLWKQTPGENLSDLSLMRRV